MGGRMNENIPKDPSSYSWLAYAWVIGLSIWGGFVSYLRKVNTGKLHKWSITELVGEIVTSALMGVITFWICEWATVPPLLSAAFIAVSGHMGSRGLFLLENYMRKRLEALS